MKETTSNAPRAHCSNCDSELPLGDGLREVTCIYCGTAQPHPTPYRCGQEVMVSRGTMGYDLGTVVSCNGPDSIEVSFGSKQKLRDSYEGAFPTTYAVEALVPVIHRPDELQPGCRVFAHSMGRWFIAWFVSGDTLNAVVKNEDKAFSGDFFDQKIPMSGIRLPSRAADRTFRKLSPLKRLFRQTPRALKIAFISAIVIGFLIWGGAMVLSILRH